jgi:hypothetical protein
MERRLRMATVAETTRSGYRWAVNKHVLQLLGALPVGKLDPETAAVMGGRPDTARLPRR